jgi:hypothetical protein
MIEQAHFGCGQCNMRRPRQADSALHRSIMAFSPSDWLFFQIVTIGKRDATRKTDGWSTTRCQLCFSGSGARGERRKRAGLKGPEVALDFCGRAHGSISSSGSRRQGGDSAAQPEK